MVNLIDSAFKDPAKTKAARQKVYFGKNGYLTSYCNEVSHGATIFKPAAAGDGGVVGPFHLPIAGTGRDSSKISGEARKALGQGGIGSEDFRHLSIVFPNGPAQCGYGGLRDHQSQDTPGRRHHRGRSECARADPRQAAVGEGGTGGRRIPYVHVAFPVREKRRRARAGHPDRYGPVRRRAARRVRQPGQGNQAVHVHRVPKGNYAASSLVDATPGADAPAGGETLTDKAHKVEVTVLKSAAGEATAAVGLNGVLAAQAVESAPADGRNDPAPQIGRTEPTASPDAQHGADLASTGSDTAIPMAPGGTALFALGRVFLSKSCRGRVMPARRRLRR
ncbi:hypothetical protein ACFXKC_46775 [Streptomyces sp. NPDC059340]|uniref:hypothetical protein n=1 Tax=Streptomyces sp. NPDC059340 TaxID=3346806 RepID=UPI0036781642